MELRKMIETLLSAAMTSQSFGQISHQDVTEAAAAADSWLNNPENGKPVRVIVDFSQGLFLGSYSNVPVSVMAIDLADSTPADRRADIRGFGDNIWAERGDSVVDPETVNPAFDDSVWLYPKPNNSEAPPEMKDQTGVIEDRGAFISQNSSVQDEGTNTLTATAQSHYLSSSRLGGFL